MCLHLMGRCQHKLPTSFAMPRRAMLCRSTPVDALMQPYQSSCVLRRQLYGFGVPLSLGWGATERLKGRKRTLQVSLWLTYKQHTHVAFQHSLHGH